MSNPHSEGLVQVHVAHVTTAYSGVRHPNLGVEVSTVQIDLSTVVMDDLASLLLTILRRISWSDRFIVLTS